MQHNILSLNTLEIDQISGSRNILTSAFNGASTGFGGAGIEVGFVGGVYGFFADEFSE